MNFKKTLLVISLLLSISFVNAQGTIIDVDIINGVGVSYDIEIILAQPSAQPNSPGSLTFTAYSSTTTSMHLEFDDTDICIKQIKCKYSGSGSCPILATLDVNCYGLKNLNEDIGPDIQPNHDCHVFSYTGYNDVYSNCEELEYTFEIN